MCRCVFFFFKLKTAYEMRISDWSSDVCSSDLRSQHGQHHAADPGDASAQPEDEGVYQPRIDPHGGGGGAILVDRADQQAGAGEAQEQRQAAENRDRHQHDRSEEHTSELQSLMRISYAVFCLIIKKNTKTKHNLT